jgi:hypothetical protein
MIPGEAENRVPGGSATDDGENEQPRPAGSPILCVLTAACCR